ncbi:MAG: phytase [Phycisphaerae bacterium]|jgi:3-phytase|nr:phytase [Phycisphaerae bacterium]
MKLTTVSLVAAMLAVAIGAVTFTATMTDAPAAEASKDQPTPAVVCTSEDVRDQDDMCIWIHPTDKSLSTVIAADKAANCLFVYDLSGKVLQKTPLRGVANIDLRYGFPLAGAKVDIVALNLRSGGKSIAVFKVDPKTRKIDRVDNERIKTGDNYGGTMFRSPKTGKFYFVTTSKSGLVEQYELTGDGKGKVKGTKVRTWNSGYSEGAAGDDIAGKIYIGEENKGVWEIGGESTDPTPGKRILKIGDLGLKSDVEGLTIYRFAGGKEGYLIVSNQGAHNFKVFDLTGGHKFLGTFTIAGAEETDGIDVTNVNLGGPFAKGMFACHSNRKRGGGCPVLLTPWANIAKSIKPPLKTDTSWDPRKLLGTPAVRASGQ